MEQELILSEKEYIEFEVMKLYKLWLNRLVVLTMILFTLFSLVDYYISKSLLYYIFPYRFGISTLFLTVFFSNRLIKTKKQQIIHVFYGATLTAISIQVLSLLSFSYHDFLYYSGYYLVIVGLLGFLPLGRWAALFIIVLVYAIFLGPILILYPESVYNKSFVMINVYFASLCVLCYALRLVQQGSLEESLKMRYRIERESETLKEYSFILKGQVQSKEVEVEQSSTMLKGIIEHAQDGVIISDTAGFIQTANPSACRIFGRTREEMIGDDMGKVLGAAGGGWGEMKAIIKDEGRSRIEINTADTLGNKSYYEVNANLLNVKGAQFIVYLCHDLTERRKMERQLLLSKKMESIGTLAGGMAHDFKNVLATIMGFVDYIKHTRPEDGMCKTHLNILEGVDIIETEVKKAADVVTQLLSVGRRSNAEFVVFDLNELLESIVSLYSKVMKNVKFELRLEPSGCLVCGNKGLIEQAISNMIINSHESMRNRGEIIVSSKLVNEGNHHLSNIEKEKVVQVQIEDTGIGIPDDIIPLIFDPFFTTKSGDAKKGTGLGLAMVYGIVKEHGGDISVDSKVGHGTKFVIEIPSASRSHGSRQGDVCKVA